MCYDIRDHVRLRCDLSWNTDDLLIFVGSIENEYLLLFKTGTLNAE